MQQTVQQITQQLIDRLPENDQYYRLDDLSDWGYPAFIVRRIKIELERNLAESMIIPKTDWANTGSEAVLEAWQQFVDAIRAEARLPASYAKTVIETAVADVLEMLVQPRQNIPEVIFGKDDQLSREEVKERIKAVVVYRHFATLIPRYMEKKELDTLNRERCSRIISNADQRLTKRYSPLNWAQLMEPLFKLLGGEVDTNLLRQFFEDKKLPGIALQLDMMNDSLSRAELIEVLSSPTAFDMDEDFDGEDAPAEEEKVDSRKLEYPVIDPSAEEEPDSPDTGGERGTITEDATTGQPSEVEAELDDETSLEDEQSTLNTNFAEGEEWKSQPEEGEEDEHSLNARYWESPEKEEIEKEEFSPVKHFLEQRRGLDIPEKHTTTEQDESEAGDTFEPKADPVKEKTEDATTGQSSEVEAEVDDETSLEDEQEAVTENEERQEGASVEDEEDTPMWMRYMSDEEIAEYEKKKQEEESEDGFIEDPIIDLTEENASEEEIKNLRKQLSGDHDFFVDKIFGGSERAFDETIEEVAAYSTWSDVSRYIHTEVFKRNMVDMYSEAAVDFTDQLQNYFLQKQNRNK